jgi:hypothetical protein
MDIMWWTLGVYQKVLYRRKIYVAMYCMKNDIDVSLLFWFRVA